MAAQKKKKASRASRRGAGKTPQRLDLTSAKSPRGGAVMPPDPRVTSIKGATVNIN